LEAAIDQAAERSFGMTRRPGRSDGRRLARDLLQQYGKTYCEELGINIARGTPSALFRWLCCSLLFSARISTELAVRAARALAEHGWTTAGRLSAAGWERRVHVLTQAGYARYDESTSRYLGELAEMVTSRYRGDLRRLRHEAGQNAADERRLLRQFKGIGNVGTDIFCREAQSCWDELYPFADRRALRSAQRLGLMATPEALATLVARADFPALITALVRADLGKSSEKIARSIRKSHWEIGAV
jgi:hypothetical protein